MATTVEPPWEELHASLRAFIGRRVRNPADIDDLVQRVLLQIVKGLDSLRDTERLHAWVYRTARNVIADHYRSPVVRREAASGDATEVANQQSRGPGQTFDEEEGAAFHELAACMAPMLQRLPQVYREAITLTDSAGSTRRMRLGTPVCPCPG